MFGNSRNESGLSYELKSWDAALTDMAGSRNKVIQQEAAGVPIKDWRVLTVVDPDSSPEGSYRAYYVAIHGLARTVPLTPPRSIFDHK